MEQAVDRGSNAELRRALRRSGIQILRRKFQSGVKAIYYRSQVCTYLAMGFAISAADQRHIALQVMKMSRSICLHVW